MIYKSYYSKNYIMVKVKLQKRPTGNGKYFTYVITLPMTLIESLPKFKNCKEIDISIERDGLFLKGVK